MRIDFKTFVNECSKHMYDEDFTIDIGDNYIAHLIHENHFVNTDEMTYHADVILNGEKIGRSPYCVSFCRNNQIVNHIHGCYGNIMNVIAKFINKSL